MVGPVQRHEKGVAPTYVKDSNFFTLEFVHGGFFHGNGRNRAYLNGKKTCYDFCETECVCMKMFEDLVEHIGYETDGRVSMYWLLPGSQLNEDGARLLSKEDEVCIDIVRMIKGGHRYLMIFLDHESSYNGGGGSTWDDVLATPLVYLPHVISPKKKIMDVVSGEEQSTIDGSYVDDNTICLKPKKKSERVRVRAEPDVSSSSDEEEAVLTHEQNQQTEGLIQEPLHVYQPDIINILTQEREASQREASHREAVHQGPLPNSVFIEEHVMSQPPVIPTTATKEGNIHRKREVLALAKLRAAAEKREVADLAKFEAAMAKLKEEEDKIKFAAQKRKEELEAKKQAAEEKKKTILEEKRLAAEEKRRATEEKKRKAQEEKLQMAEKKRKMMDERKRTAEMEKQKKAAEKRRIAEEKKMITNKKYQQEEAAFLIHQAEEFERHESWRKFKEDEEAARQNAWEQQNNQQDTTRNEEWELRKRRAEETNKKAMDDNMAGQARKQVALEEQIKQRAAATSSRAEEARFNPCPIQGNNTKKKSAPTNQNMTCFKKPRKVNMFDEFRLFKCKYNAYVCLICANLMAGNMRGSYMSATADEGIWALQEHMARTRFSMSSDDNVIASTTPANPVVVDLNVTSGYNGLG
ncbi:hypothetical protein D1007_39191 [Hordeum vulgare]|nr:hypothetical protein D1007_39191 [Hordeum vulgare]